MTRTAAIAALACAALGALADNRASLGVYAPRVEDDSDNAVTPVMPSAGQPPQIGSLAFYAALQDMMCERVDVPSWDFAWASSKTNSVFEDCPSPSARQMFGAADGRLLRSNVQAVLDQTRTFMGGGATATNGALVVHPLTFDGTDYTLPGEGGVWQDITTDKAFSPSAFRLSPGMGNYDAHLVYYGTEAAASNDALSVESAWREAVANAGWYLFASTALDRGSRTLQPRGGQTSGYWTTAWLDAGQSEAISYYNQEWSPALTNILAASPPQTAAWMVGLLDTSFYHFKTGCVEYVIAASNTMTRYRFDDQEAMDYAVAVQNNGGVNKTTYGDGREVYYPPDITLEKTANIYSESQSQYVIETNHAPRIVKERRIDDPDGYHAVVTIWNRYVWNGSVSNAYRRLLKEGVVYFSRTFNVYGVFSSAQYQLSRTACGIDHGSASFGVSNRTEYVQSAAATLAVPAWPTDDAQEHGYVNSGYTTFALVGGCAVSDGGSDRLEEYAIFDGGAGLPSGYIDKACGEWGRENCLPRPLIVTNAAVTGRAGTVQSWPDFSYQTVLIKLIWEDVEGNEFEQEVGETFDGSYEDFTYDDIPDRFIPEESPSDLPPFDGNDQYAPDVLVIERNVEIYPAEVFTNGGRADFTEPRGFGTVKWNFMNVGPEN